MSVTSLQRKIIPHCFEGMLRVLNDTDYMATISAKVNYDGVATRVGIVD